jgi:hypothetical protein
MLRRNAKKVQWSDLMRLRGESRVPLKLKAITGHPSIDFGRRLVAYVSPLEEERSGYLEQ